MNILVFSELFHPHGGGGELATYLYSRLLSEKGFNVVVVTNRFSGEPEVSKDKNFTVYRLPLLKGDSNGKYSTLLRVDILFSSLTRQLMKRTDVVYIPKFWLSAIPLAKIYGKPIILHLHGYLPVCPMATFFDVTKENNCRNILGCSMRCIYSFERRKRKLFDSVSSVALNFSTRYPLRKFIESSDAIICVSEAQKKILVERMPFLEGKSRVIYNPLPSFPYSRIVSREFGYFGGSNPLKGFSIIYTALNFAKTRTTIHATGFDELNGKVKIVGNSKILFYKKLPEMMFQQVYEKIRAVIVPSLWAEPWGYVVTEGILRCRVIIASRVGGIPEQVESCKGVFLFSPGNYEQLAELIDYVNGLSEESLIDLGFKNREVFLRKFGNDKTLARFIDVVKKVCLGI
jgi:glycosyltransferase involved in cell wall biosynthesis